jgi:hypothetical protein
VYFFPSIEESPGRVHHRSEDSAREKLTGRMKAGEGGRELGPGWGRVSVNIHCVSQGLMRNGLPSLSSLKKINYQCFCDGIGILFCSIHFI